MLYSTAAQVSFSALVLVTIFVLWAGQTWARLSALLHLANWLLVSWLQIRHAQHQVFQTGDFTVEACCAVLALGIAVKVRQPWAAAVAAFQILGVSNYLVVLLDHRVMHRAFWTLQYIWEAGELASIAWSGAEGLRLRRRQRHATIARD